MTMYCSGRSGGLRGFIAFGCFLLAPGGVAGAQLLVFAGVAPVGHLAERVGGDRVAVRTLVPEGQSPHTFEPTPRQLAALERADLYLAVGMPFEAAWTVRLEAGVPGLAIAHLAEAGAGHDHGAADPHAWTDPLAARDLAAGIRDALARLDPDGAPAYGRGFEALAESLEALHRRMGRVLDPVRGRIFTVYHPAWGALAERYGLRQLAVEARGKSPGARHLVSVIEAGRAAGACAVFAQPQFSTRAAREVAGALGAPVVVLDPLAPDLEANLLDVARTLARYLESPCPA